MFVFCVYMVVINLAFMMLGALLYLYSNSLGLEIPAKSDQLYPKIAFGHLDSIAGIFFILGLVASTYASSDSALTALTTSFCIDFLNFEKKDNTHDPYSSNTEQAAQIAATAQKQRRQRTWVHLGFSLAFVVIIKILYASNNGAVLGLIFKLAGYTYGPLLGLYVFGLFTSLKLHDRFVPFVCVLAPLLTWAIEWTVKSYFDIGFLTILVNGLITTIGLWVFSYRDNQTGTQESSNF